MWALQLRTAPIRRTWQLLDVRSVAERLQSTMTQWCKAHCQPGGETNPVAQQLHGPLFEHLYHEVGYHRFDERLLQDLMGFPLVGELPPSV